MNVTYVQTHYPVISQTFLANEVRAVKRLGINVKVQALWPGPDDEPHHPDFEDLNESVVILHVTRPSMLKDLLVVLATHPRAWRGVWRSIRIAVATRDLLNLRLIGPAASIARRSWGTDHFHAHFAEVPAVMAALVATMVGVRFSFTAHAHIFRPRNRALLLHLCTDAAFAIVPSHSAKQELLSRSGVEPAGGIHVVHNGIDLETFSSLERLTRTDLVVSVARLVSCKGIDTLIEACALLHKEGLNLECELVGDGDERQHLEALTAELGLEKSITFHGAQPAPFVRELLARATIFALGCRVDEKGFYDTLPVAITEAMAAGVPVVATSIAGIPEVVRNGETGIRVEPNDVKGLAKALRSLLTNADLREGLAAHARSLIEKEFDQKQTAGQVAELFERFSNA